MDKVINTMAPATIPKWKLILTMMLNPGEVVRNQMVKIPWPLSLSISGLAFTLFFLQTGLDMYKKNQTGLISVIVMALLGLLYGTAGIALLAVAGWLISNASSRGYGISWAVSTFALGYSTTLIYAVSGLVFSLAFGWKTSVAFGVTGVLWALRPIMYTVKQMSSDNTVLSVILTTLFGAIILIGWSLLGGFAG